MSEPNVVPGTVSNKARLEAEVDSHHKDPAGRSINAEVDSKGNIVGSDKSKAVLERLYREPKDKDSDEHADWLTRMNRISAVAYPLARLGAASNGTIITVDGGVEQSQVNPTQENIQKKVEDAKTSTPQ